MRTLVNELTAMLVGAVQAKWKAYQHRRAVQLKQMLDSEYEQGFLDGIEQGTKLGLQLGTQLGVQLGAQCKQLGSPPLDLPQTPRWDQYRDDSDSSSS